MTTVADRKLQKPRFYHERSGKSVDYIRARCKDGSLKAFDLSEGNRPDWYIDEDDWTAFLETKVNQVQPPQPKRQKRSAHVVEFFK